jgi:cAMP-dependent protein kinase regulator
LALLYNAPRAATIEAEEDCLLWSLDRATFNHIVKDAAARKREKYEEFLKSVTLLSSMDHYERSKLADAIKETTFKSGEFVIKQGEEGKMFFVIVEGEAIATKVLNQGEPAQEVMKYKQGDYFGELALLKNEPRAANVLCISDVKCVSLERSSFKRLLGPLDEILRRNMGAYANYSS